MMSKDIHPNRAGQRAGYHPFSLGTFLLYGKYGQRLLRGRKWFIWFQISGDISSLRKVRGRESSRNWSRNPEGRLLTALSLLTDAQSLFLHNSGTVAQRNHFLQQTRPSHTNKKTREFSIDLPWPQVSLTWQSYSYGSFFPGDPWLYKSENTAN